MERTSQASPSSFGRPPRPTRDSTPRYNKWVPNNDSNGSNPPGPLFLYSPGLSPIRAQQASLLHSPAYDDNTPTNTLRDRATRSLMAMTPPSLLLNQTNDSDRSFHLAQQSLLQVDQSINTSLHPMSLLADQSILPPPSSRMMGTEVVQDPIRRRSTGWIDYSELTAFAPVSNDTMEPLNVPSSRDGITNPPRIITPRAVAPTHGRLDPLHLSNDTVSLHPMSLLGDSLMVVQDIEDGDQDNDGDGDLSIHGQQQQKLQQPQPQPQPQPHRQQQQPYPAYDGIQQQKVDTHQRYHNNVVPALPLSTGSDLYRSSPANSYPMQTQATTTQPTSASATVTATTSTTASAMSRSLQQPTMSSLAQLRKDQLASSVEDAVNRLFGPGPGPGPGTGHGTGTGPSMSHYHNSNHNHNNHNNHNSNTNHHLNHNSHHHQPVRIVHGAGFEDDGVRTIQTLIEPTQRDPLPSHLPPQPPSHTQIASHSMAVNDDDIPPRNVVHDTPTRFDEEALRRPSLTMTTIRPTATMHLPLPFPAYEDYGATNEAEKDTYSTGGRKREEDPMYMGHGHGGEGDPSNTHPSGASSSGSGGHNNSGSGGKKSMGHIYRVVMNDDGIPALVPLTDPSTSPSSFHFQCDVACQTNGNDMIWEDNSPPPLYQGGHSIGGVMYNGTWRSRLSYPPTFSSTYGPPFGTTFGGTFGSSSSANTTYGNHRISKRNRDYRSYTTMFAKYKHKEEFTSLLYSGGSSGHMSKGGSTMGLSPLISSPYYKRRLDRRNYNFSMLQNVGE